jgi:hypothetical protein
MYDNLTNWLNIITSFHLKDVSSFAEIAASNSILSENNIVLSKSSQFYNRYDSLDVAMSDATSKVRYNIVDYMDVNQFDEFKTADVIVFASPQIVTIDNASKILEAMVRNFTSKNNNTDSHLIIIFPMDIMSVSEWFDTEYFYTVNFYSSVRDYKNSIDYHYISIKHNDDLMPDNYNQSIF